MEPRLDQTCFTSFDGTVLPLKTWFPASTIQAVIIALHGYNDYSNFIRDAAPYFNDHGIAIYAYDQRGFGETLKRGRWSGCETMCLDLRTIITLVRKNHPGVPLYLLGDSMGGAVVMAAQENKAPLPCSGIILVAPAVWSRTTMPFYQRWVLWLGARIAPWMELTGESLDITASDNEKMLKALGRDPLVIKKSRIDSIFGLTNLMDTAYKAAPGFNEKALFLYGARDEIIPPRPMADVYRQRLNAMPDGIQRFLVYNNGYHMLLRDLQAEVVWQDIISWIDAPDRPFTSVLNDSAHEVTGEKDITAYIYPGHKE